MTRIAFVSDVHGNLPALRAVLAELDQRGSFDALVGGGDYAFGGAYPDAVLRLTRERGFACVRGNTDEWIVEAATAGRIAATGYGPAEAHSGVQLAVDDWVAKQLSRDSLRWLSELPVAWETTGPSGARLVYVHATPWSTHQQFSQESDDVQRRILDEAGAPFVVHGHIHVAYVKQLDGRTIAGTGSVGMPFDQPLPVYLIASDDGDGWQLEHVRVRYDRDSYLQDLARCGTPNASGFIDTIRRVG